MRVKSIAALAFPPERQEIFGPYGIAYIRLRGLCIATLVPGIQGTLCMSSALRKYVCSTLVGVAHKLPQNRADLAIQSEMPLHPTRFPLRYRTHLFHGTPKFGTALTDAIDQLGASTAHVKPAAFRIACPHCSAILDAAGRKLYGTTGWSSLVCKQCGKASRARKWNCACQKPWVSCSFHHAHGYACIGSSRANSRRCTKVALNAVARRHPKRMRLSNLRKARVPIRRAHGRAPTGNLLRH